MQLFLNAEFGFVGWWGETGAQDPLKGAAERRRVSLCLNLKRNYVYEYI